MNQGRSIRNLVSEVLAQLERLNYSENTRTTYRRFYNRLVRFADSAGERIYSEGLGNRFLQMNYKFDMNSYKASLHYSFRNETRFMRVLGDYQLHGAILRRRTTRIPYKRTPQFEEALKGYYKECVQRNYSESGMRSRVYRTELFID